MILKKNNKTPHFIWFCIYWLYYNLIFGIVNAAIIDIIDISKHCSRGFFSVWFGCDGLFFWGWLAFLFPLIYYKVASKLDSVEIDERNKTIHIIYHPFIFLKKEISFSLEDENFTYRYKFDKKPVKYINLLFPGWTCVICFYENKRLKILFHDVSGWKREQLEEIVQLLEKHKKPTE